MCDQSYHFVKGESSINNHIGFRYTGHMSVHTFVHEPEGDGFVTYKSLVMAFTICDVFFSVTTIGQCVYHTSHVPVIILLFFQELKYNSIHVSNLWQTLKSCNDNDDNDNDNDNEKIFIAK